MRKFIVADEYRTREVEHILSAELENWILFGRKRDWMPAGFRCPLGFAYKPPLGDVHSGSVIRLACDENEAMAFDRVVCSLPERYRQAFVMHHLDRCHVYGYILIIEGRERKAQILGVGMRRYHGMVQQAHEMVLARWAGLGRLDEEWGYE